jgi:hypothetical protein
MHKGYTECKLQIKEVDQIIDVVINEKKISTMYRCLSLMYKCLTFLMNV